MIRRPPRSTPKPSSAASDVYKRQPVAWCRTTVLLSREGGAYSYQYHGILLHCPATQGRGLRARTSSLVLYDCTAIQGEGACHVAPVAWYATTVLPSMEGHTRTGTILLPRKEVHLIMHQQRGTLSLYCHPGRGLFQPVALYTATVLPSREGPTSRLAPVAWHTTTVLPGRGLTRTSIMICYYLSLIHISEPTRPY